MMSLSKIFKTDPNDSYYERYYKQAVLFEIIGAVLLIAGLAVNYLIGHSVMILHLCLTLPGVILLLFGGSGSQSQNIIRSFAQLLTSEPTREAAEALLTALTKHKKIALVNRTVSNVRTAIEVYAQEEDADPEILAALREAAENRIIRRIL